MVLLFLLLQYYFVHVACFALGAVKCQMVYRNNTFLWLWGIKSSSTRISVSFQWLKNEVLFYSRLLVYYMSSVHGHISTDSMYYSIGLMPVEILQKIFGAPIIHLLTDGCVCKRRLVINVHHVPVGLCGGVQTKMQFLID